MEGASFDIKQKEICGIVGESGSGKSVTALSILRILSPNAKIVDGKILFKGRNLLDMDDHQIRSLRGKEISMVFQDALAGFDPVFTIADQIGEAVRIHREKGTKRKRGR